MLALIGFRRTGDKPFFAKNIEDESTEAICLNLERDRF